MHKPRKMPYFIVPETRSWDRGSIERTHPRIQICACEHIRDTRYVQTLMFSEKFCVSICLHAISGKQHQIFQHLVAKPPQVRSNPYLKGILSRPRNRHPTRSRKRNFQNYSLHRLTCRPRFGVAAVSVPPAFAIPLRSKGWLVPTELGSATARK